MFSNSSQIIVNGGVFNNIEHRVDGSDKGLELLYSKVATGALYNSGERFDPPKCHPNTRTAILHEILDWLNEASPSSISPSMDFKSNESLFHSNQAVPSMWINGPAGAGKSAIAQTIAQMCFDLGQLSSTFFFSRTGGARRRDAKHLVPTLAYEMMKHIPETQRFVSSAVLNDPLVFDLSLEYQMETLIVGPLACASDALSFPSKPRLIVIDGLDECAEATTQCLIVNTLINAIGSVQHNIPHKLLILSRPEPHLVSLFNQRRFHSVLRKLLLDDQWQPDDDIRLFLVESIQHIKINHPLSKILVEWPASHDINELVRRSSGQFVYASTVIKALKSERHHPMEVMNDILSLRKRTKNRPFAELDALYDHIFSKVVDLDTVLFILRISLARSIEPPLVLRDPGHTAQLVLGLQDGMVEISLNELSAVVSVTRTVQQVEIKFLHASLADYLLDASRSGRYFINSEVICVSLYQRCMSFLLEEDNSKTIDSPTVYHLRMAFSGPIHFAHHIQDRRLDLHFMLSELNLESTLSLAAENVTFQAPGLLADMTEFLVWGFREYKESSGTSREHLSMFVDCFRRWTFTRLESFPFNGFDNELGLDLTVFAMSPTSLLRTATSKGFFNDMIDILQDVIQAKTGAIQMPQGLGNELSLCWSLMPGLATFFEDVDFAGPYTVTPKRYCDAAVLCLLHLLREEPPRRRKGDAKWVRTRHNYLQAIKYTTFFLIGAEARLELYHLCRKLAHTGTRVAEDDDVAINLEDEDDLHPVIFGNIDRLISRLEERTGGKENPWTCDVTLASGLSISVANYLLKTCKSLSLSSDQDGSDGSNSYGASPQFLLASDSQCLWALRASTMRWFWWNERNVLRWIT